MIHIRLRKRRGDFTLALEFQAATSGVTALFGHSGCGKSTTTHLLAGLLTPDAGRIEINGELLFDSTQGIDVPAQRRRVGYVFQDSRLFPHLDIEANLRYGLKRATTDAGIRFNDTVELLGLRPLLKRQPITLSGGERQRVAIGRALLSQPRLLLLDEPLASLDAARRAELLPWLTRLRDELALPMVYVSHQFEEVLQLADYVVLLEHGAVSGSGSVTAMSRSPALRALIGDDSVGSVLEGCVQSLDPVTGLACIHTLAGPLSVDADQLQPGQRVRVQLLARDLILCTEAPRLNVLSVRNCLAGHVQTLTPDGPRAWLIEVATPPPAHATAATAPETLLVRITTEAYTALQPTLGMPVWVLVKAVSLRGHVFASHRPPSAMSG